ncbi:MAG: TolC family protein [Cyanobacteria bacterium J06638_28]
MTHPFTGRWHGQTSWALLLAVPLAQGVPVPTVEEPPNFSPLPSHESSVEAAPLEQTGRSQVAISLPELIELVVTGNRDLRDQQLERLVQRQELREAEAAFDPRLTPITGLRVRQSFADDIDSGSGLASGIRGDDVELSDRTVLSQGAGLLGEVTTRQGTEIGLTVDVLGDTPLGLRFTQPLLQGAGTAVNEAPVNIARLVESRNFFTLQQTVIDTVTATVTQYTRLIEAQRSVAIQAQALTRRQRRLAILAALVDAGRRAEVDLVDARRSIADAERDLLLEQTQLEAANTALLDLVGTDRAVLFVASEDTIADLFTGAQVRVETFEVEALVAIAYRLRPDYLQIQLDQDIAELNQLLAEDDLRWELNVEGDASVGDFSESTVGLIARRTFDDPSLDTALIRSQVEILQQENQLAQQQTAIRNEITNQLNTVRANLARVEAARRATANARLQLEVAQELFNRGRTDDIFQIITQEENLVQAEDQQLGAEIEFLNSVVDLDQAVGLTLNTWSDAVDFLPVLLPPDAVEAFESRP